MGWLFSLLIGLALTVVAYLLMPKPKKPAPPAIEPLESPTAEAGIPIPVLFGTLTHKGANILWFGEKAHLEYEIEV